MKLKLIRMYARLKRGKPTSVEVIIMSLIIITVAVKMKPQKHTIHHQPSIKVEYSDP